MELVYDGIVFTLTQASVTFTVPSAEVDKDGQLAHGGTTIAVCSEVVLGGDDS